MSKSWDSGILKKLKALVDKGLPTSEIGKRLGLSKNAVVGKLYRLGWNAKASEESKATSGKTGTSKRTVTKKKESAVKKTVAKKVALPKKAVVAPKKKATKTPQKPAKSVKSAKNAKVAAPKKEAPKRVSVGRTIAGRNVSVHQRVIQHALEMANLKSDQCRWPIGDPDSEGFHFCGQPVFVGKPYCYEHCKQAYQFAPPKKK
ncbi:MAG: hypothetical protein J5742_04085 [Alphaproteobacteria bacterium]|nr:hypothetical protein [Alphaproteobacteria bacterium]